ncbi:FAD-dependent monooxygenase [Pluralibacter gergoviae]|uniref:FAD-dependent monooxygenase n=1 Tax=Pluralibacter gergoviae TaxID=61647 RepID=UPI003EE20225
MNNNTMYDIAIVGYGPVGQLLSLVMGRQGYRVAVFERWESLYPLPRAVFHDHEIRRVLRMLDLEQEVAPVSHAASSYEWYSADWRRLLALDWGAESISGGPFGYFFNQPDLEAIFNRQVKALPNVNRYPGHEVERLSQTADGCELVMVATAERDDPAAERQRFQARYVIGADGANSTVRRTCGIDWLDLGFAEDWLVVDVRPRPASRLIFPKAPSGATPNAPPPSYPAGRATGAGNLCVCRTRAWRTYSRRRRSGSCWPRGRRRKASSWCATRCISSARALPTAGARAGCCWRATPPT